MFQISPAAEPLAQAIRRAGVFSRPTFSRFTALMIGLIVTMGRRTVSHSLVAMRPLLKGHWSNYHRLYSSAKYSMWSLAAVMVRQVVALLPADAVIELVADDTVDGKEGEHVWAKSAHRDPIRSTQTKTATKMGHTSPKGRHPKGTVTNALVTQRGSPKGDSHPKGTVTQRGQSPMH